MDDDSKNEEVSIIILNWNGWKDTIECLESLYQINYPYYNVILVDNCSEDNSLKKIREYCEGKIKVESNSFDYSKENKPIKIVEYFKDDLVSIKRLRKETENFPVNRRLVLIKNDKNYGFAEGNNIGIKFVLKELDSNYILLLNNDTVVDKLFLNYMVEILNESSKIGVVGPRTYYYDYDGENVTNFDGGRINYLKGEASHISNKKENLLPRNVDYIEGSCFLIKKHVIEDVGLLDEEYFLYWEETDWCSRIKKKGYELIHVPKAKIWHKSGTSITNTNLYYMTRNRFVFMKKNSNKLQMLSFLLYFFLFKLWFRLFAFIFYYKEPKMINYFVSGIKDGLNVLLTK